MVEGYAYFSVLSLSRENEQLFKTLPLKYNVHREKHTRWGP